MVSDEELADYIKFARTYNPAQHNDKEEGDEDEGDITDSPSTNSGSVFSSLDLGVSVHSSSGFGSNTRSSTTSYSCDPHAVSRQEALSYYAGLPSKPTLLFRTGMKWTPPSGPEAHLRRKELRPVFHHSIVDKWNGGLGLEVAGIMDAQKIFFSTIDVVRFIEVEVDEDVEAKQTVPSPVTIWIGIHSSITSATAAHDAAKVILALLEEHGINDVDIHFRESSYRREVGGQLYNPVYRHDPLAAVIGVLTPALGIPIATKARPNSQGTLGLYLSEGDSSDRLLAITCRHVLIGPNIPNVEYTYHPSGPSKKVIVLGDRAYAKLFDSIKAKIGSHGSDIAVWREQINDFANAANDPSNAKAAKEKSTIQKLIDDSEEAIKELSKFLKEIRHWSNTNSRILGTILHAPPIRLGVGDSHFTEDWGIILVDRGKLGPGFKGNVIDLGTDLTPGLFTEKCFTRGYANWRFKYPSNGLLPLNGVISNELMRAPDMWDINNDPCLLVVKNGNATGTTLGRANSVNSITRVYNLDGTVAGTSMEWCIVPYDSHSGSFSQPGDSGSIIADIRGRIGGMLTGGAGKTPSSDVTYATPFGLLLDRIKGGKFPNAQVDVAVG